MQYGITSLDQAELRIREFVSGVYGWMAGGLALTAVVAMSIANNPNAVIFLATHPWIMWLLIIAQIAMVFSLSIARMSGMTATIIFILYSGMMGVTLSGIFLVYTKTSIAQAFFTTAGMFGIMAIYGHTTKTDLTRVGQIGMMALIGIILASLINLFFRSSTLQLIISVIGVILFTALTAYDSQKIKQIGYEAYQMDENTLQRMTILGALVLYLDFVNLFLYLLQLMGRRED